MNDQPFPRISMPGPPETFVAFHDGLPFDERTLIARFWHRPPFTLSIRLLLSPFADTTLPSTAVIGTRGTKRSFVDRTKATILRLTERFAPEHILAVKLGTEVGVSPWPGTIHRMMERLRDRLLTEWWSIGELRGGLDCLEGTQVLTDIDWWQINPGDYYLADPFVGNEAGALFCERMPLRDGHGDIVVASRADQGAITVRSMFASERHHSYPCRVADGDNVWFVPESTDRGATTVFRLTEEAVPEPASRVAPDRRLADPTLFYHNGLWWIACTDLDIGEHDNLCLFYAGRPDGLWVGHRITPAKIDITGARPAGAVFKRNERLFRPAQDCARTYGGAITLCQIETLSPTTFSESKVATLIPDRRGPFPDGAHTVAISGDRVWIDGKRMTLVPRVLTGRIKRRLHPYMR